MVQMLKSLFDGRKLRWEISFAPTPPKHFIRLPLRDAKQYAPIGHAQCLAVDGDEVGESRISRLLFLCRPSAILGHIRAIVIDAVNGMKFRWPLSHVRKEILKAVTPSFADRYAACSVNWELVVLRIEASLFYNGPSFVFRALAQVVRSRIGIASQQGGSCFEGKTAAAHRRLAKVGSSDLGGIAAFALAQPKHIPVAFTAWYALYDCQAADALASQIKSGRHEVTLRLFLICEIYR